MAKALESCTQLIVFLCTFPWLLWSFSSIHENYKHVIITCKWNSHKNHWKKIVLIIACFAQSPSSKFSTYRVKVTATERPQLEWKVRGGPGAQLQKRLPVCLSPQPACFFFLPEGMNTLPAVFITSGSFKAHLWEHWSLFSHTRCLTPVMNRLHQASLLSSFQLVGPKEARISQESRCLLLHLFSNSIGDVYLSQQRAIQLQVAIQLLFCTLSNSAVTQAPAFHHPQPFFLSQNNTVAAFQWVGMNPTASTALGDPWGHTHLGLL